MPYLHWDYLENHKHRDHQRKTIHDRRSLDEAGYSYHSKKALEKRNNDQVVTKYFASAKTNGETLMVVVDQLWLWILEGCK